MRGVFQLLRRSRPTRTSFVSTVPRLKFAETLHDITVKNSESAQLKCRIASTHLPYRIAWQKNQERLENSAKCRISCDGHTHAIQLISADTTDRGTYTCTATCPLGKITCSATLAVLGKVGNTSIITDLTLY